MNQRLSRKEIKRDEFMESVGGALEYVREHSRKLLALAGAIIGAVVIFGLVFAWMERREAIADAALAEALRVYQAAIDPVAADPANPKEPSFADAQSRSQAAAVLLEAVRDSYGSSDAGALATVYLGQIAIESGDEETARALWEEFVDRSPGNMLASEVRVNLMALDRAQGKGDQLVTRLRAMLSGPDEGLPHDLLWYQLALTLETLGRQEEAREAYQRIVDDFPQSAYASTARQQTAAGALPPFGT